MNSDQALTRFLQAQEGSYRTALEEIKQGRKRSHWMWYIFPQIAGLGFSETARFYAIKNRQEAKAYLEHLVLGPRLIEISQALLRVEGKTANQIFGTPDDLKLRSSMTLFLEVAQSDSIFQAVLDKYFKSQPDQRTLDLL